MTRYAAQARRAALHGNFAPGQAVEFDAGRRGGTLRGVLVEFAGTRWVLRTVDGKTWRVPASLLRPAALDADRARALLTAGKAGEADRATAKAQATAAAQERLAPRAARFSPGDRVEVVHRGSWGWQARVVSVSGGKVVVTNPTRDLFARAEMLGFDAHRGLRTSATVTLWANRVRPSRTEPDVVDLLARAREASL